MSLFAIGVCILPVLNLCDSIAPKVISRSRAQKAWWWHGCFKGRSTSPACCFCACKLQADCKTAGQTTCCADDHLERTDEG